jgi:catechol 2,3-dioxygenase-like lactoylglutathione lyase family enzyme
MQRPAATLGMRHVALNVRDLAACEAFYAGLLGMVEEWRPDPDNLYLTSGNDNLALHRVAGHEPAAKGQRLDHIGFFVASAGEVDAWYEFLKENNVAIMAAPRTHRDGARSFYCSDPEGTVVQVIHHPPIVVSQDRNKSQANA